VFGRTLAQHTGGSGEGGVLQRDAQHFSGRGSCLLLAGAGAGGLGAELGVAGAGSQGGPGRSPGGQLWGYHQLCHTWAADKAQQETSVRRASPLGAGVQLGSRLAGRR